MAKQLYMYLYHYIASNFSKCLTGTSHAHHLNRASYYNLLANDFTVAGNSWDLITITCTVVASLSYVCDSHVVQTLQSQLNSSIGLLQLARHCVN